MSYYNEFVNSFDGGDLTISGRQDSWIFYDVKGNIFSSGASLGQGNGTQIQPLLNDKKQIKMSFYLDTATAKAGMEHKGIKHESNN